MHIESKSYKFKLLRKLVVQYDMKFGLAGGHVYVIVTSP